MKYPPFKITIRLIHIIRHVKGRLFKRPLCIRASLETWLQHKVPNKPPSETPSLDQWRAKAQEIKHKQIAGRTKHLKARYAIGDPVYTLNPNSAKLEPNHLGPFKVAAVYDNHTYQLEDAQGNTKKLHHNCLHPCRAIPTQMLFMRTFPDLPHTPVLVSDDKQGAREGVATKFPHLPANVS
ncbi:hypothetical protein DSO57_1037395 [Entomophthora muscae]|uniref:Uncharacterized protein n=1 Tax=Entomophthora muscae TaxID=34485 RepID=A0ACC2RDU2_9FUNG|nr:hypothetical protein DSO57_1037395 [Entomophthora muscae]